MKKGISKVDFAALGEKVYGVLKRGKNVEVTRGKDGNPKVMEVDKHIVG